MFVKFLGKSLWFLLILYLSLNHERVKCEINPQLYFYSREFPTAKLLISSENVAEYMNITKPMKFLIHGWGESSERTYFQQMTDEYLIRDDVQVFQVDWSSFAKLPYLQSAESTRIVGSFLGDFLIKLEELFAADVLHLVHIVGHSLGAHAAGHVGKSVKKRVGKLPARITGLDPAGPHFELVGSERLTSKDAVFVDVTHTDGNYFGLDMVSGHVDFYPNGGHRPQPGCEPFNIEMLQMNPNQIAFCSHVKSYIYFIASINNKTESAVKCESYEEFKRGACNANEETIYGENVSMDSAGKFYFDVIGHKSHLIEPHAQVFNTNLTGAFIQNLLKVVH